MEKKYHESAWIIGEPEIGEGTWIGAFTVIDGSGGLKIGKGCDISSGAHIYTHSTVNRCINGKKYHGDGSVDRALVKQAPVEIGECTFIGANATVLMGSVIGDRCVIGAGAVVSEGSRIPSDSVVVGVPGKIVGSLNNG